MIFSIFAWFLVALISIFLSTLAVFCSVFDRSKYLPNLCCRAWGNIVCKICRISVEINGLENLNKGDSQILISNHQGFFDIFVLSAVLPIEFRFLAKESLFQIPFLGWGMSSCGHIGIDRSSKKKALKSFLKTSNILKAGKSVIIFPEGTRQNNDNIGELKKGSLLLALRSKKDLVPITISGSGNVLRKGSFILNPGKIRVTIDKPIDKRYLKGDKVDNAMDSIKKTFEKNIAFSKV